VIIASDGDANVGIVDTASLSKLIRDHADTGISLTTLGFGTGNFRDHRMEQLADDGDGNYYYIDGMAEAKRIFIDQLPSTMEAIARDVKIQVEWNPESVHAWRLIGYENRAIADRDFRNDAVDAGEVGSGHSVTALYAIGMVPGATSELGLADVATVRLRYKPPGPDAPSTERAFVMQSSDLHALPSQASADQQVAIAAAAFAERLRGSPYAPPLSYAWLAETVERAHRTDRRDDASIAEMMRAAAKLTHD
jgi:Ca-activated chloride channel family protein